MAKKFYQVADKFDSRKIAEFLSKDGQLLLPFLELICNTEQAVDELIDVVGKGAIEAVLLLSAQQIAGLKQPGKARDDIGWHGRQFGVVSLSERKLRVEKPRLRKKGKGPGMEVPVPAYEALVTNSRLGSRILEILMKGVSTRKYKEILPKMADTVGVSKSQISREFMASSEVLLKRKPLPHALCALPLHPALCALRQQRRPNRACNLAVRGHFYWLSKFFFKRFNDTGVFGHTTGHHDRSLETGPIGHGHDPRSYGFVYSGNDILSFFTL